MLFVNLYQNNVFPNLPDAVPGNYIFAARGPETEAEAVWSGNYQSGNAPGLTVKLHIHWTAKSPAGTDIDHFFLFQFADTHGKYLFFYEIMQKF